MYLVITNEQVSDLAALNRSWSNIHEGVRRLKHLNCFFPSAVQVLNINEVATFDIIMNMLIQLYC